MIGSNASGTWSPMAAALAVLFQGSAWGMVPADLGITPEALAACGGHAGDVAAILARLAAATESIEGIASDEAALDSALAAVAEAEAAADGGEAAGAALSAAHAEAASISASLAASREGLAEAIAQDLDPGIRALLARWRANASWRVPQELRVLDRSESEWRGIEIALRAKARAATGGAPLDPTDAGTLASIDASPEVAAAQAGLASQAADIAAAFAAQQGS